MAVTIVTRRGDELEAVLGFHDGSNLIYERWDTALHAPSGDYGALPLGDIAFIVVP